jgi:cytochrome c oxidase assembly factor CtaG
MFGWIAIRFQPATDQQLAGLVMWILGGSVYVIATLVFLALWIASSGKVPPSRL